MSLKKRIAKTFIFAMIAAAPFLWPSILTVNGTGGWSTAGIELLIFPILFVFIIWLLLSIIRMIQFLARKGQAENEGRSSPITLGIVIGGVLGIWVGGELRMYGFELAAERAEPLIDAIESYSHDNGKPPATLDALVPNYLIELPAKLPPLEIVTDSQQLSEYGDNPWALTSLVSRWIMNWDRFIYFPDQAYPTRGFGGGLERVGAWAYVHE
jgi:hypothetical protein